MACSETGSHKGTCCCNCLYQCEIEGHPWNDEPYKKTERGQILGYGCAAFFVQHQIGKAEGVQAAGSLGKVTFFDRKHGMCEMHTNRLTPNPI